MIHRSMTNVHVVDNGLPWLLNGGLMILFSPHSFIPLPLINPASGLIACIISAIVKCFEAPNYYSEQVIIKANR